MSSNEASDGPAVAKTVVETVASVSETTITTIKANTNSTSTTVTTKAVEVKANTVPVKTVTEAKTDVARVEPTVKAVPAPTKTASTPAKTEASPAKAAKSPVKATNAKAPTPAKAPAKTAAKPAAKTAPPGYKLIKVKNADGKIIVVKKKLTEAELAAAAEKKGQAVTPDNKASEQTKSVEYKIVSIPQSDGTLVKVRRAVHAEDVADKSKPKPKVANAKDDKAVAFSDKEVDDADEEVPISEAKRQEMIRKQKHKFRMGRTRKYRRTMLRGFAMQLIGELPDIELDSHGFQDGDQVISDDDSDLDFDSDGGGDDHDLFGHHNHDDDDNDSIVGGGNGNGNGADHSKENAGTSGSGSHIDISSKAIATNVYDNVAAQTNKKKPVATAATVEVPPPAKTKDAAASGTAKPNASEKITYKMNEKDLEKLDEEKPSSQLQHHWENISFYLMASLSIILPLLFVLLCIGTTIMDGKSVGSHWDAVANALKFAVSAWPIVFAAVVAQCFKTYATYRVERGIKLMQLEQLVGSNSFASALKQPIMLRRLDIYTLAIFVAWCLSPIGGQAIVRVQSGEWRKECTTTTVWYLSRNGINPVFDADDDYYKDGNDYGTHLQQATMTFGTIFNPDAGLGGKKINYYQDNWGNPQTFMPSGNLSSVFGIPYFVTDSLFYAESQPYYYDSIPQSKSGYDGAGAGMQRQESFNFTLESSYFAFECGDWQTLSSADMADKIAEYDLKCTATDSPTYYMAFGWPDSDGGDDLDGFGYNDNTNASASILRWGSFDWLTADANASTIELIAINGSDPNQSPMRNSTAAYSYIECSVAQHYLEYNIQCGIVEEDYNNGAAYQCLLGENPFYTNLSASTQHGTPFYEFTSDFVDAVVPTTYTGLTTISPFERFLASGGRKFDTLFEYNDGIAAPGKINSSYAYWYDMANNTTPYDFGGAFSFAFNSWMDAGYCPGACRTAYPTLLLGLAQSQQIPIATVTDQMNNASSVLGDALLIPKEMFQSVEGTWCYTAEYVYVVHAPYLVLLYVCSISLFVLGIVSVIIESRVVAPDVLGYASTVARNSRYLHLPATAPGMSGADRVRKFGGTVVMMQDVKKDAAVGKIALGNKKHDSAPLRVDRTYR